MLVPYDEAYEQGFEDMPAADPGHDRSRSSSGWRPRKNLDEILADVIAASASRELDQSPSGWLTEPHLLRGRRRMRCMPDEAQLIAASLLALAATLAATPLAIAVATRTRLPRPARSATRATRAPTPYLGGRRGARGFLLAGLTLGGELRAWPRSSRALSALWALGTLDDRVALSPRCAAGGRVRARRRRCGRWTWAGRCSGATAVDLAAHQRSGWSALVNAFNLMDNMDGAAATVGAVTAIADRGARADRGRCGLAALVRGTVPAPASASFPTTSPARLGSSSATGAACRSGSSLRRRSWPSRRRRAAAGRCSLAAVILAGLPVLDTALVMVSRRRAGMPLLTGGRDHLTHRLVTRLGSPRAVALALGVAAGGARRRRHRRRAAGRGLGPVGLGASGSWPPRRPWCCSRRGRGRRCGTAPRPARPPGRARRRRDACRRTVEAAVIVFIAVSCGLSPALYGFYDASVWGPIALVLLAALLGLLIARPAAPRRIGLGRPRRPRRALALVARSRPVGRVGRPGDDRREPLDALRRAVGDPGAAAARRPAGRLLIVVIASAAAVGGLGGYLTGAMLVGDGPELFLRPRLNEPLGYINGQAGYLLLGLVAADRARRARANVTWLAGARRGRSDAARRARGPLARPGAVRARRRDLGAIVLWRLLPGRGRRLWALVTVGRRSRAALGPLLEVYDSTPFGSRPTTDTVATAAATLLGARPSWPAGLGTRGCGVLAPGGRDLLAPGGAAVVARRSAAVAVAGGGRGWWSRRPTRWTGSSASTRTSWTSATDRRRATLPLHLRRRQPLRLLARCRQPVRG